MKRVLVAAAVAAALLGCGGDEVDFDPDNPPPWLVKLDDALPAKQLRPGELAGNCLGIQFLRQCEARVSASRSMTRKAKFALEQGSEVRITYEAGGNANPVTVTLRDKAATVPVRKSGGTLTFRCRSVDPCRIDLL